MKRNIVLIGMSGAGKSTLGVLLAKSLGMDFVDTDILLQGFAGKKLQSIIDTCGIERFMELEEQVVSRLDVKNCVVATGGSVVYSDKAMQALKKNGTVVYLYVSAQELLRRLTNITTRGIVMRSGSTLEDVLNERLPLYDAYSDITFDFSGWDIESCVSMLAKRLGEEIGRS